MAAGLGFKTFTTGEVLTAADTNGYLMQGINVFASTAARDAAITSPQEGQFAFTKDTNGLWYYDGAAWVASGATGDIEGVTAGIGISGGGTSGTVTVTNSMATAIDAKGDLIGGTGADTFSRIAVGANNTVLTADSTAATGLKWAAPAGGGKVLQVVSATSTTSITTSSTSYVDSNLSCAITPTSATSKVLVLVMQPLHFQTSRATFAYGSYRLMRGATSISDQINSFGIEAGASGRSIEGLWAFASVAYLDSPATTSATTYKTQILVDNSGDTLAAQESSKPSSMVLLEIGA
jgi:hypothetical protein